MIVRTRVHRPSAPFFAHCLAMSTPPRFVSAVHRDHHGTRTLLTCSVVFGGGGGPPARKGFTDGVPEPHMRGKSLGAAPRACHRTAREVRGSFREEAVRATFARFDADGSGAISLGDLQVVFGESFEGANVQERCD